MMLSDQEIRHLTISLLKLETDRDKQSRIGASNLSNQCDFCLASNFIGDDRTNVRTDQFWLGRTWGTAQHAILDKNVKRAIAEHKAELIGLYAGARSEEHVFFADIPGYGAVGGTIDLLLERQLVDWKSSTRAKLCILADHLAIAAGRPALFGRKHRNIAKPGTTMMSERDYSAELFKMEYKVAGYYGQQNLYMRGAGVKRASLVLLARDGNGMFDNATAMRYNDPTAMRDIQVLSFDYDATYTDALIARGTAIWGHLESGGTPADFEHNPLCFACQQDAGDLSEVPDIDVTATFAVAA